MTRTSLATALYLLTFLAFATDTGISLAFWAGPDAKRDKRVTAIEEHHACSGQRAYARVTRMPAPGSKGTLQPEVVVEFSPSGGVIGRWSLPVDEIVLGVRGKQIVVPHHSGSANDESALFISLDRSLAVAPRPNEMPKAVTTTCPRIAKFRQSAYLRCFEYVDLESKVIRRLAYQMPCT